MSAEAREGWHVASASASSATTPTPGRTMFVTGVLLLGLPIALALDLALLALRGELATWISVEHAMQLALFVPAIALAVGGVAGAALARRRWPTDERLALATVDRAAVDEPDDPALEALAGRVHALAQRDEGRLVRQGTLFAVLGYAYAIAVGGGLLTLALVLRAQRDAWGSWVGVAFWALFSLAFLVLAMLLVRWQAPEGRALGESQAARLRAMVARVAESVGARPPHVLALGLDFNAFAAVVPRFGLFGFARRSLVLGLPLLEALREDELRALLAHELAHHGRSHLRRVLWIVRVRAAWTRLHATMEAMPHWGAFLVLPFARWYVPRLELFADALSRRDEHDADRAAAAADARAAARLLLRMAVWDRYLAHVAYPAVRRHSAEHAHPDGGSLERLRAMVRSGPSAAQATGWLRDALTDATLADHSHPSLGDRLRAIGIDAATDDASLAEWVEALMADGPRGADLVPGATLRRELAGDWEHALALAWRSWWADAQTWRAVEASPLEQWPEQALRARAGRRNACRPTRRSRGSARCSSAPRATSRPRHCSASCSSRAAAPTPPASGCSSRCSGRSRRPRWRPRCCWSGTTRASAPASMPPACGDGGDGWSAGSSRR